MTKVKVTICHDKEINEDTIVKALEDNLEFKLLMVEGIRTKVTEKQ